jgi:hypothetical protein
VLAEEGAAAPERLDGTVDVEGVVGQLALGLARVGQQHADAAVDVELGVEQRGAGLGADRVEPLAVLAQVLAEGLEQRGALVERELPQGGAAGAAAVVEDGGEVDAG